MHRIVFVYGTLKEGFANFNINAGQRVPGVFQTVDRFPLYVIGEYHIPWLVDRAGQGERVLGQLFHVDPDALRRMDELERLDEPGWFKRREVEVRNLDDGAEATALAYIYFGDAQRLSTDEVHAGPMGEFTADHDQRYRDHAG